MTIEPGAAVFDATQRNRTAPPHVPFGLSLGVTGHRAEGLPEGALAGASKRLSEIISRVAADARRVAATEAEFFASGAPAFAMLSPLAEGADQAAAEIALDQGFSLKAVLPFAREDYTADFPAGAPRERFEGLLGRASCTLELPGDRIQALDAYIMAGRATVAHADILIAVWDGLPARGRGGTGEVVALALTRGTPIIHIPIDQSLPVRIVWSGFDPHVVTTGDNVETAARDFDDESLHALLDCILAPPADAHERGFLRSFLRERERNLKPRVEYPLLLAMTGIRAFGRSSWRADPYSAATRAEWSPFRDDCATAHGVVADLDPLEEAYGWSDRLATHFAQTYRSGHVFNFILGAAAVLIALTGLLLPGAKLVLALAEFAVIIAIIGNTRVGTRSGWHRRWLDYRQLAERLRPMRSLKLLGLAAPDVPASGGMNAQRRWIDWYAAGLWRTIGCPAGKITAGLPAQLAAALARHELAPQIAYHRGSSKQVAKLDHRLHLIGTALFFATIIGCIALIAGYLFLPEWTTRNSAVFVFLSAGLPAMGTAIFGIRVQGDFAGTAERSRATAEQLEALAKSLDKSGASLPRAGDLFEQAARAMLADLGQWRLAHYQHELALP